MLDMVVDKSSWLPEDCRQSVQNWMNACKQERERFKRLHGSLAGIDIFINYPSNFTAQKTSKQTNQEEE